MPMFDFQCQDCGEKSEILITGSNSYQECRACGSTNLEKLLSIPSSLSGVAKNRIPGPGDTACCGVDPEHAGCAGPGSCCGKAS
ncbi:MAG: zinc ribbon domain-containing protein [Proteobacteria bacterium]|nr:zinc ribbon domain-containing protein [Pseudomonadota bacterium]